MEQEFQIHRMFKYEIRTFLDDFLQDAFPSDCHRTPSFYLTLERKYLHTGLAMWIADLFPSGQYEMLFRGDIT